MPIKSVLFDLEGTLVHVKVDYSTVVEFLMGQLRSSNHWEGGFQQANDVWEILRQAESKVERSAFELMKKSVSSKLAEVEKAAAVSSTERKNARTTISSLQVRGMKAAVITGLSELGAKEVLRHMNLEGTVAIAASRGDSTDHKERIAGALKKLNSKPDDVIFVADSGHDVEAAKSLGVRCFAVYSQEVPANQVLASKPDAFLYSIAELSDTLFYFAGKSRSPEGKPAVEPQEPESGAEPNTEQSTQS